MSYLFYSLKKHAPLLWGGGLLLCILMPTLWFGQVWEDDTQLISHPQVAPSIAFLHQAFFEPFFIHPGRYWRPVGVLSFQLGNLFPLEDRMIIQRVIQLLIACWLYISLSRLFNLFSEQLKIRRGIQSQSFSSLLALALMLSPLYLGNIAWISCRFELLLALSSVKFCMAIMNWMDGYRSTKTTAEITFWMIMALLSKEIAPLVLLCSGMIAAAATSSTPRKVMMNFIQDKKTFFILFFISLAWLIGYQMVRIPGYSMTDGSLDFKNNAALAFWAFYGYAQASIFPWSATTLLHPIPLNSFAMESAGGAIIFALALFLLFHSILKRKIKLSYLALASIIPLIALSLLAGWTKTFQEFPYSERYLGGFPVIFAYALFLVAAKIQRSTLKLNWTSHRVWTTISLLIAILAISAAMSLTPYANDESYWTTAYAQSPQSSVVAMAAAHVAGKTNTGVALAITDKRRIELLTSKSPYASSLFYWNLRLLARNMELQNDYGDPLVAVSIAKSLSEKNENSPVILTILAKIQAMHGDCENAKKTFHVRDNMLQSMSPKEKEVFSPTEQDYQNEANILAQKCQ